MWTAWASSGGRNLPKGEVVKAEAAPPDNGLHPTPHHELSHVRCVGARVMPGVRRLNLISTLEGLA